MRQLFQEVRRYIDYPYLLWDNREEWRMNGRYFGEYRVVDYLGWREMKQIWLCHRERDDIYIQMTLADIQSLEENND